MKDWHDIAFIVIMLIVGIYSIFNVQWDYSIESPDGLREASDYVRANCTIALASEWFYFSMQYNNISITNNLSVKSDCVILDVLGRKNDNTPDIIKYLVSHKCEYNRSISRHEIKLINIYRCR